jgi:hypothetical protein
MMLFAQFWSWAHSALATALVSLLAAAPAFLPVRYGFARWPTVGWIFGLSLPAVVLLIAYAAEVLLNVQV